MSVSRRLVPVLVFVTAFCALSARAAEPEAMATAPAVAPPMSVADQIDNYLKTSPALVVPKDGADGVTPPDEPRKIHGVADVAVGSNGYRSAFVESDIPVGKTGTVSIAVGEQRFKGRFASRFGGPYAGVPLDRQTLGLGLYLGDAAPDPHDPRCRQTGEDGSDMRDDARFGGGRPRFCRGAEPQTSP